MLTELTIRNLAIIENQSIRFSAGFNVISGETGAGKSLMLQALAFLMGEKLSSSSVGNAAEELEVHGVFEISEELFLELPEIARVSELVISRTQPREGRSRVLINGRPGSLPLLQEIVPKLVSISSQHQSVKLLKPAYHLKLLDEFCGISGKVSEFSEGFRIWSEKTKELNALKANLETVEQRRSLLEQTVEELKSLGIKSGLRAQLSEASAKLTGGEKLLEIGNRLLSALRSEDGPESLLIRLSTDIHSFEKVSSTELSFKAALETLSQLEFQIEKLVSGVELDDQALELIREKLSQLARLERKYKLDDSGLFELLLSSEKELLTIDRSSQLDQLSAELKDLNARLLREAQLISELRLKGKELLEVKASADLAEVAMAGAAFKVEILSSELKSTGIDQVRFLIAPNIGSQPRELGESASGGELSRLTLVLKRLLRDRSGVPVLVFDEVDTGISGRVARSVGRMLRDIATNVQVICITHLPQVASLAESHLLVSKIEQPKARTVVEKLDTNKRVDEIARMLSGNAVTQASRASARELIRGE